jgi:molybdopterin synthase catalytic subunit
MAAMNVFDVRIQSADFVLGDEVARLRAGDGRVGAVVSFVGTVRELQQGAAIQSMELEHYPGMTERAIAERIALARQRFGLLAARVIHRIGALQPQEQIVLVAVCAVHRGAAFAACEYIMDYLKTEAPFWKKEQTAQGAHWVDARDSDLQALDKWRAPQSPHAPAPG